MAVATKGTPLSAELIKELERIPEGEKIKLCIQCGTCTASCPTSHAMDYTPRQIVAALRSGQLDKILASDTVWLCASCYSCTVRCPSGIQFTDMMYALKRLGLRHGLLPEDKRGQILMDSFVGQVDDSGINSEMAMMRKYFLRTGPLAALRNLGFAYRMWRKGRLPLRGKSIKGRDQLKAIAAALKARE